MCASLAVTLPPLAFVSSPPARLTALRAVAVLRRGGVWALPDHRRYRSAVVDGGRGVLLTMGGNSTVPRSAPSPTPPPSAPLIEVELKFVLPPPGPARRRLLDGLPPAPPPTVFVDVYYDAPGRALTVADTWLRTRDGVWQLKHPLPREAAGAGGKGGGGAPAPAPPPAPSAAQAYVEVDGDAPAILAALGWDDGEWEWGAPANSNVAADAVSSRSGVDAAGDAVAAAAARRGVVPFATIVTRRVSYAFSHGGRAFWLDLDEAAFPDTPAGVAIGDAAGGDVAPATCAAPDAAADASTAATPASQSSLAPVSTNGELAFVYAVGELETLVASPADVPAATADVAAAAAARGIALPTSGGVGDAPPPPPRGKLATFLAATAPAHYAALVAAGVLPS